MLDKNEVFDEANLLLDITERASILQEEITEDFLFRLDSAEEKPRYGVLTQAMIARADAHRARLKGEILGSLLDELFAGLEKIVQSDTRNAVPNPALAVHEDVEDVEHGKTRTEMIDRIINDGVMKYVSMIENFSDWRERLRILDTCALMLAMGWTDINVTGREPKSKT